MAVEFQVRAAHEDIWGEINHQYLYKIASPYVWSPGFHDNHRQVAHASQRLKKAIDSIPSAIIDLISASNTATSSLATFSRPSSPFHFSLGASIYWHLRHDYDSAGHPGKTFHELFQEYENLVAAITKSALARDQINAICQAIRKVEEIRLAIVD